MLEVAATIENVRKIMRLAVKHGLTVDDDVKQLLNKIPVVSTIAGFNFNLKDFQAEGVAWLEKQGGCGLLADEQGTGKTVQVIAYAHKNHMFPMLVLCPNTLKLNWRNEIIAMTGLQYRINVVGKNYSQKQTALRAQRHPNVVYSKTPTEGCDIYIVNYDIIAANVSEFEDLNLRYMAVDESHKIKNPEAKRTKAILRLAIGEWDEKKKGGQRERIKVGSGIQAVTLMSGTPAVNRPNELWTSVQTVARWVPEFSKWTRFGFRYCGAQQTAYGWNFSGASNTAELNELLKQHCMLRRLKADVLKDLPPKVYRTLPLEFDRREYDKVASAFNGINWQAGMEAIIKLGGNAPKSNDAIVAIQKLREIAGYAKLDSSAEWIQDYTEEGEKLVVFAHNRQVIEHVKNKLEEDDTYRGAVGVIYGGVSDEERADAVLAFQNNPAVRVILVGITAGGFGLTLTAAKAVAFLQLPWTPGEISQCADRIHRIGQVADSVTIFNLVAEGTIEEEMADMLISKGQVLDQILDAGRVVNTLDLKL
jgi:SWI/SNF-related matrix-associated actin-dependent regulator of chromatin subfamily A-like protein 1